jgi:hypothetical protein
MKILALVGRTMEDAHFWKRSEIQTISTLLEGLA